MADYFFKIFTSLRNCNVACSPALRLGGASEQLSGLCLQKVHSSLFKLGNDREEEATFPHHRVGGFPVALVTGFLIYDLNTKNVFIIRF